MRIKIKKQIEKNEDNLLPLVNIIFLLLIFFMLAGVIAKQKELHNVNLASATIEEYIEKDKNTLFINADGALPDAALFANANFATAITGTNSSGYSLGELGTATIAAPAATLNCKIVGFDDQASTGAGAVDKTVAGRLAVVKLNLHYMDSSSGI